MDFNLDELFEYLLPIYDIGIWTAGTADYANFIVFTFLSKFSDGIKSIHSDKQCQNYIIIL
jgi:hypothetical protein